MKLIFFDPSLYKMDANKVSENMMFVFLKQFVAMIGEFVHCTKTRFQLSNVIEL